MTSITATGADTFSVTDNSGNVRQMSGEMLMQLLAMRGSQVCAGELQVQMQKSSDVLDSIEEAERYHASMGDKGSRTTNSSGQIKMPPDAARYLLKEGLITREDLTTRMGDIDEFWFNEDKWNLLKEDLQAHIHKLNGQSQMDYIRLQSLTNQNNRLFSLMDSIETKSNQTKSEIIRDIK